MSPVSRILYPALFFISNNFSLCIFENYLSLKTLLETIEKYYNLET